MAKKEKPEKTSGTSKAPMILSVVQIVMSVVALILLLVLLAAGADTGTMQVKDMIGPATPVVLPSLAVFAMAALLAGMKLQSVRTSTGDASYIEFQQKTSDELRLIKDQLSKNLLEETTRLKSENEELNGQVSTFKQQEEERQKQEQERLEETIESLKAENEKLKQQLAEQSAATPINEELSASA